MPALHFYQLSLPAPKPLTGTFNAAAAKNGERIYGDKAKCATCHVPPIFTEPGWNLHTPPEIGIDDFQAKRSPDGRYRTAPLRALWDMNKIHKGGFYHDGRERALSAPANITLLPLPSASPQFNPVERVWLYVRERYLSHRVLDHYHALLDATCRAWNKLMDQTGRLATLTTYPYLAGSGVS